MHQIVSEIARNVAKSAANIVQAVCRKSTEVERRDVRVTLAVGHAPAAGTLEEIDPSAATIGDAPMPL